jgi:hypothetical protein
MELYQRAETFENVLRGVRRREHYDPTAIPEETRWGAASLLGGILAHATLLAPPLQEAEARQLLPRTFDSLHRAGLLRVVLGCVDISRSVEVRLRRAEVSNELDDLRVLDGAAKGPSRGRLWIPAKKARALHKRHGLVFTTAPSWEVCAKRLGLHTHTLREKDGFTIDLHEAGDRLVAGAVAAHWESELRSGGDPGETLRSFTLRYGRAHGFYSAAGEMIAEAKSRFLDAAVAAILAEPDLGSWKHEVNHLKEEFEGGIHEPPPPPTDATSGGRYAWWDSWESSAGGWDRGMMREKLDGLIAIVVRFDNAYGAFDLRYGRISQLFEASESRPYLAREIPTTVQWQRPEAIAWLLTRRDTTALGLMLLSQLDVPEETTWDEFTARDARKKRRQLALFNEALPIFTLCLSGDYPHATAPIAEALLWFARTARDRPRSPQGMSSDLRDGLWSAVASARLASTSVSDGRRSGNPLLLSTVESNLRDAVAAAPRAGEVPLATLWILHRLLAFTRDTTEDIRLSEPLSPLAVARSIARQYGDMLAVNGRRNADGNVTRSTWFGEHPELAQLPWEITAVVLSEGGELEPWLHPKPPEQQALAAAEPNDSSGLSNELISAWTVRLRHHLDILVAIHQRLRGSRSWKITGHATGSKVTDSIEEAVGPLVTATTSTARRSVDLFDRNVPAISVSESVVGLVAHTVRTVERFREDRRIATFKPWIERTRDPVVLLAMLDGASTEATRSSIQARLAVVDVLAEVEEQHWFPSIQQLVFDAARLGQADLAKKVIEYGNRVVRTTHRLRAQWDDTVFRSALLLSLHAHDEKAIQALPIPPSAMAEQEQTRRSQLEDSRTFYLALARLEHDPLGAKTLFDGLLVRQPRTGAFLIDYFASVLRVAERVEDPGARREAFEAALREWERLASLVRDEDRERIAESVHYNRMAALYGAERDDEADEAWASLDPPMRFNAEFVALRLKSLRRRQLGHEAERLIADASSYHGGQLPSGILGETDAPASRVPAVEPPWKGRRAQWLEIRQLQGGPLARVVAPSDEDDLPQYLLQVHVEIAREFLLRSTVLKRLKDENKYNDILVSMLNLRLGLLGWHAEGQSRGGHSFGKPSSAHSADVGARDWVIVDGHREELALTEAFRLSAVQRLAVTIHTLKLFGYNATMADQAYVMVFFEGRNFDKFVDRYLAHVQSLASSPWTLKGFLPCDSAATSSNSHGVKVLRASYEQGRAHLDAFHLLMRLNPPLPKRRGARSKRKRRKKVRPAK